jgi:hypothetical protein
MAEETWVKTVYGGPNSYREPDISPHPSKKEAESFISTCLQWGIGIVSCEIVPKPE